MILIADSGGSKTDWALISLPTDNSKYVLKVRTQGFSSIEGYHFTYIRTRANTSVNQDCRTKQRFLKEG